MIRHRDVALSPEEAARYDDDQRENLRSWGVGVPEPIYPDDPDEPPLKPHTIQIPGSQPNHGGVTFIASNMVSISHLPSRTVLLSGIEAASVCLSMWSGIPAATVWVPNMRRLK